jgi:WD40 repeat protein
VRFHAVLAIAAVAGIAASQTAGAGSPPRRAGKILFVGGSRVLVVNADGTGLRDLSSPGETVAGVTVSPDGTRIVANLLGCCLDLTSGNGTGRVRIGGEAGAVAWAPDSKHFAYADQSGAGNVHVVSATGNIRRTLRVAANGYAYAGLAWSPDASRLAFITETGVGVVEAAGGSVTMPSGMSAAYSVVGWSPDGTKIAFLTRKNALYVARVDGGLPTLVGRGQADGIAPAWSPNGKRFLMTRGDPAQIHVVDVDGTHDRRLTQSEWGEESTAPAWSPDGKSIVFLRGRLAGFGVGHDVWTMTADGADKQPLTNALELNGADVGAFLGQSVVWVPGRAAGGIAPRPARTIPVHASRAATVPVVYSDVSADASGLAVSAGCKVTSWDGARVRVHGPASGLERWPCAGGAQLASAGGRTAWISSHGNGHDDYSALYVAGPSGRRLVESAYSYCCNEPEGKLLSNLAGDGPLLVYNTSTSGSPTNVHLWRIDGSRKVPIRSGRDAGLVVAVDSGRIATLQADGTLTLLSGSGARLTALKLGKDVDAVRLDGSRVVLLRHGRIEVYDAASGRRREIRRLGARPDVKATLEDAQDGFVVYTAGLAVHVLRLSDGRDVVLGLQAEASEAHAQLVPSGLYYAYNRAWTRRPGRLGFVSMQEVERILAGRG